MFLISQKNQKHLSSAKLVEYLLLINQSQKLYFFTVVLPRTVANDVSAYQVTS